MSGLQYQKNTSIMIIKNTCHGCIFSLKFCSSSFFSWSFGSKVIVTGPHSLNLEVTRNVTSLLARLTWQEKCMCLVPPPWRQHWHQHLITLIWGTLDHVFSGQTEFDSLSHSVQRPKIWSDITEIKLQDVEDRIESKTVKPYTLFIWVWCNHKCHNWWQNSKCNGQLCHWHIDSFLPSLWLNIDCDYLISFNHWSHYASHLTIERPTN